MNYLASVTDFFKSPKWLTNLLLSGVCVFIPIVGPLVLRGWLITGFWGREQGRPESFPDFDFNHFLKYLERGLWPFLVSFVSSIVLTIVALFVIIPVAILLGVAAPDGGSGAEIFGVLIFLFITFGYLAIILTMMVVLTPLTVRAALMQDFIPAFNFTFLKRFLALTWKESLLAALFLIVAGTFLVLGGAIVLCFGMYFAMGVVAFCGEHLHKQLYQLYLSRGGEPVALSPKLWDAPPVPPPPVPGFGA